MTVRSEAGAGPGALPRLLEGYRHFRAHAWPERRATFEHLSQAGQSPRAMVVACSDSRVDPAMIFSAGPGELFVMRNIANLVPPYQPDSASHGTSAALEFAVRVLEVTDLVVMGHTQCGGIRVLLEGAPEGARDFLLPWMRMAEPARRAALARHDDDPLRACEQESVCLSLENLRTFPWVAERERSGALTLSGMIFDTRSGLVSLLGPDHRFLPFDP
jgi:carbonic anhydrase